MEVASLKCAASVTSFSSRCTCSCTRLNIALQSAAPHSHYLMRCCFDARRRFIQQLLQPVLFLNSSDRNLLMLQNMHVELGFLLVSLQGLRLPAVSSPPAPPTTPATGKQCRQHGAIMGARTSNCCFITVQRSTYTAESPVADASCSWGKLVL